MDWFKPGLYAYLKFLVRFSFGIFYRPTVVLGKEKLRLNQPTILATNHPNTLIDALNAAGRTNRVVFFLVNAGLYASPTGKAIFNFLYCIPVKRQQDPDASGINNNDSFSRCYDHLNNGGYIFIAPEGESKAGRRLRRLKPGTARIALEAQKRAPKGQAIQILPIGLTYRDQATFGSTLVVEVGTPIQARDYLTEYQESGRATILKVTHQLSARLESLIIHTQSEEEDQALDFCEHLFQPVAPLPLVKQHQRSKQWLAYWQDWAIRDPLAYQDFIQRILNIQTILQEQKTTAEALQHHQEKGIQQSWRLILGLPLYLYGYCNNFLAAAIPKSLANLKKVDYEYKATVQILVGLITFPLFYTFQTILISVWFPPTYTLAYLLTLLPAGLFAWHYRQYWKRSRAIYRLKNLPPHLQLHVFKERDYIVESLTKQGTNAHN